MLIVSFDIGEVNLAWCTFDCAAARVVDWQVRNLVVAGASHTATLLALADFVRTAVCAPLAGKIEHVLIEKQLPGARKNCDIMYIVYAHATGVLGTSPKNVHFVDSRTKFTGGVVRAPAFGQFLRPCTMKQCAIYAVLCALDQHRAVFGDADRRSFVAELVDCGKGDDAADALLQILWFVWKDGAGRQEVPHSGQPGAAAPEVAQAVGAADARHEPRAQRKRDIVVAVWTAAAEEAPGGVAATVKEAEAARLGAAGYADDRTACRVLRGLIDGHPLLRSIGPPARQAQQARRGTKRARQSGRRKRSAAHKVLVVPQPPS